MLWLVKQQGFSPKNPREQIKNGPWDHVVSQGSGSGVHIRPSQGNVGRRLLRISMKRRL